MCIVASFEFDYDLARYINPSRKRLMNTLYDRGPLDVSTLCANSGLRKSAVEDFIRRFVWCGGVTRSTDNTVDLTPKGRSYVEALRQGTRGQTALIEA